MKWWSRPWSRYLVAGGTSFLFNVALLNLFRGGFHWPIELSAALAFWGTFGFSYTMQRRVVFRSGARVAPSMVGYGLLALVNSVAVTAIVTVLNRAGLGLASCQFVATGVVTCWNFVAYKYLLFRTPRTLHAGAASQHLVPGGSNVR